MFPEVPEVHRPVHSAKESFHYPLLHETRTKVLNFQGLRRMRTNKANRLKLPSCVGWRSKASANLWSQYVLTEEECNQTNTTRCV